MVTIANRYQLQDKLGEGGMGAVYRAFDPLEQTIVALKRVNKPLDLLQFNSKVAFIDERTAMVQEFRTLASLRHPNIISVLDYGFDDKQQPFFTMDLLDNATTVLDYGRDKSEQEKALLLIQILQALVYLHRRDILHRDLKPANVLVTVEGKVKVLDFGLSTTVEQAQGTAGTLAYMAPEVLREQHLSQSTDLYAVGVIAYELFVGQYPFKASHPMRLVQQIMQTIPDLSAVTNTPLELVLMRWLMKDPDDRYPSAQTLITGLCDAVEIAPPQESIAIRESFLQASEFVGRDDELQSLKDELRLVLQGATSFYLVGGESGVGKSRLLDELRTQALVSGATVIHGQAIEGGGLPFQLWRQIVRRLLLIVEVTDLQAGILMDVAPDVNVLLGRKIEKVPELTGKAHQDRIVLTIVELIRVAKQPIVLLLEDLHWTSESLSVLKQLLLVREQFQQLMIVGNYRNDEAPTLSNELPMKLMQLERLSKDVVQDLSTSMLGKQGANEQVIDLLQKETEGNLFFLVETVRVLAEEAGSLGEVGNATLPETILTGGMQQILQRRLRKVDEQYQSIQTLAAIIGRKVDIDLLSYHYDQKQVEEWLINASAASVVDIQDNTWRFAHDKLRETLISNMIQDKKITLHRQAAEAIEMVYPNDAGYYAILLNHWQQVGNLDKSYEYTLPIARNMIEFKGTFTAAEAILKYCLNRLPQDDARNLALWNWLARSAERQGNYDVGQTYAQQTQQRATTHKTKDELAISLHHLGNIAIWQGEYEHATNLHQQSLKIKQELGNQLDIATSLNNLGVIAYLQGDYVGASELYQQSLAIKEQLGDQHSIAMSLNNLGEIARIQGEYERAVDLYQQNLELCQQIGEQSGMSISLNNLGLIAHVQALYSQATDFFQQSLSIRQKLGDQRGIASSLNKLGRANQKQNIPSYRWFQQSLTIAHNIQTVPLILANVVGFAEYFIGQNQMKRSAQFIGLVQHHPKQNSDVQRYSSEVLQTLETTLSPNTLEAELEYGKQLDLDTVVQGLLNEFGQDNE